METRLQARAAERRRNGRLRVLPRPAEAEHHTDEARRFDPIVMKFGGTSLADPEKLKTVARRLVAAHEAGARVVAVLSAMGETTDELLDLARQVSSSPSARELDMLVSVGERISCALCAMAIHDLGYDAISLTGSQAGIVTDGTHGKAKIVDVRAQRVRDSIDGGSIVLVAGFQGISPTQDVTTLGRGGSDTTAVALAAALGAEACEIYTDVDGVFTADPRLIPQARMLHAVSYGEMLEMAAAGARVLQLRSVEYARNHKIKVHVRSSFSGNGGTWIVEEDDRMLEQAMISGVMHTFQDAVYRVEGIRAAPLLTELARAHINVDTILQTDSAITFSTAPEDASAVAIVLEHVGARWSARTDLGKVSVVGAGMKSHPGIAAQMFATLAAEEIEPEIVATSPIKIACYVSSVDVSRAVRALHDAFGLDSPSAIRSHA